MGMDPGCPAGKMSSLVELRIVGKLWRICSRVIVWRDWAGELGEGWIGWIGFLLYEILVLVPVLLITSAVYLFVLKCQKSLEIKDLY